MFALRAGFLNTTGAASSAIAVPLDRRAPCWRGGMQSEPAEPTAALRV